MRVKKLTLAHTKYIKDRGKFTIDCSKEIFSEEEIQILVKYGHWLEALHNNTLTAFTLEQQEFIDVLENKREAKTVYERAFLKYVNRKRLEIEQPEKFAIDYKLEDQSFYSDKDFKIMHPEKGS